MRSPISAIAISSVIALCSCAQVKPLQQGNVPGNDWNSVSFVQDESIILANEPALDMASILEKTYWGFQSVPAVMKNEIRELPDHTLLMVGTDTSGNLPLHWILHLTSSGVTLADYSWGEKKHAAILGYADGYAYIKIFDSEGGGFSKETYAINIDTGERSNIDSLIGNAGSKGTKRNSNFAFCALRKCVNGVNVDTWNLN